MNIILTRHGQSQSNVGGTFCGHKDVGLTPLGEKQSNETREHLKDRQIGAVYSSDLRRARETAEIVTKEKDISVITDARLRELNIGTFKNRTFPELKRYLDETSRKNNVSSESVVLPEGESLIKHRERVLEFIKDVLSQNLDTILIVAHGRTNLMIHSILRNIPLSEVDKIGQENSCINEFNSISSGWECSICNFTSHLTEK